MLFRSAFVEAVNPSVAIRSTGQSRRLTLNGIEALAGRGRAYYSTADNGCVRIRLADGAVAVTTMLGGD